MTAPAKTSDRLLRAAIKCISQKGVANVSLRNIAVEADVVLSQITYYFKNKEGLFAEILKHAFSRNLEEIEQAMAKREPYDEKVLAFASYHRNLLNRI